MILDLPLNVLDIIAKHLSVKDQGRASCVNRGMRTLMNSPGLCKAQALLNELRRVVHVAASGGPLEHLRSECVDGCMWIVFGSTERTIMLIDRPHTGANDLAVAKMASLGLVDVVRLRGRLGLGPQHVFHLDTRWCTTYHRGFEPMTPPRVANTSRDTRHAIDALTHLAATWPPMT